MLTKKHKKTTKNMKNAKNANKMLTKMLTQKYLNFHIIFSSIITLYDNNIMKYLKSAKKIFTTFWPKK